MLFFDQPFFRRNALTVAVLAGVVVFILWNIPQLSFVLYPVRLFVTFIHEAGHSVMAALTGGRVIEFTVFDNGTGVATTAGGLRHLILPAGYLGTALFGAVLFFLSNTLPFPRKLSLMIGTLMIIITLFLHASGIALIVGLLTGLALIFVGLRAGVYPNVLLLNVLAILTGLNSVLDLLYLVQASGVAIGPVKNDAAAFADLTLGIPAAIWAMIWALLAIFMLSCAVWFSIGRQLRQGL
jgi:hypothetical protein